MMNKKAKQMIKDLREKHGKNYMVYRKDDLAEEHVMEEINKGNFPKEFLYEWEEMSKI